MRMESRTKATDSHTACKLANIETDRLKLQANWNKAHGHPDRSSIKRALTSNVKWRRPCPANRGLDEWALGCGYRWRCSWGDVYASGWSDGQRGREKCCELWRGRAQVDPSNCSNPLPLHSISCIERWLRRERRRRWSWQMALTVVDTRIAAVYWDFGKCITLRIIWDVDANRNPPTKVKKSIDMFFVRLRYLSDFFAYLYCLIVFIHIKQGGIANAMFCW